MKPALILGGEPSSPFQRTFYLSPEFQFGAMYVNDQRIATRVGNQVYFIHGDHLGSTTLLTDEAGNEVSRVHLR